MGGGLGIVCDKCTNKSIRISNTFIVNAPANDFTRISFSFSKVIRSITISFRLNNAEGVSFVYKQDFLENQPCKQSNVKSATDCGKARPLTGYVCILNALFTLMPVLQPIVNIAELLYQKGITDVLVSPGSRSAPLTLAVARHPRLRVRVMADERSSGFVALGLVQQSRKPVAVICTSGSAVYNLAPAVVEAFFQQVPLILLTADRPHEWLYQQDGQTIDQPGLFGSHVKRVYD